MKEEMEEYIHLREGNNYLDSMGEEGSEYMEALVEPLPPPSLGDHVVELGVGGPVPLGRELRSGSHAEVPEEENRSFEPALLLSRQPRRRVRSVASERRRDVPPEILLRRGRRSRRRR